MKIGKLLGVGVLCLLGLGTDQVARAADAPAVAAAADLKFALTEVAALFKRDTGQQVRVAYGSSGTFTTQIEHGAPFQLFLSADENFVFRLADAGHTADRGTLYAIGRLALFAPHGSRLKVDAGLNDLKAALADGRLQRFAIANPDHAPYGRAARAALQHAGLWTALRGHLVLGENVSQAMQFAAAGASQGGIVPLSMSKEPEMASLGNFAAIPAAWHASEPLKQRMVLLKGAGKVAADFYRYLQQPTARQVFVRHGFELPSDAVK